MSNTFTRRGVLGAMPFAALPSLPAQTPEARAGVRRGDVHAMTQLGMRSGGTARLTLLAPAAADAPGDELPFYVLGAGARLPRRTPRPPAWSRAVYQYPFNLSAGATAANAADYAVARGTLRRADSRWGRFWQGEIKGLKPGLYVTETEYEFGLPFVVEADLRPRLLRGYLNYVRSQRSGEEVYGIRGATNTDDAVLDSDGSYVPAAGGWYDAGDLRKWMSLTAFHLEGLAAAYELVPEHMREQVREEMRWGNRWIHAMVTPEGRVWEDIGGGEMRGGLTYEDGWWTENHPGCIAGGSGNRRTDNVLRSGDERLIRTSYNPWVQFGFVRLQAMAAPVLGVVDGAKCLALAERSWQFGVASGHDGRTMFLAGQLRAALELLAAGSTTVPEDDVEALVERLLGRQDQGSEGLSHFFVEADGREGYRSVAFSCEPAMALLRYAELKPKGAVRHVAAAERAVRLHIEQYLLADAKSNPFGVPPYGIFHRRPHASEQTFREAGRGYGVRTFIHPYNDQFMVHGTNSVVLHQAHLLARAGRHFGEQAWTRHAELLLEWVTGHNPTGLSMFTGVGHRHPVAFSLGALQIPDAIVAGFAGWPDDSPYLETGSGLQWSTQEIWGIPWVHTVGALRYL